MTKEEIIAQVDQSFSSPFRPKMFIRGTCSCDENYVSQFLFHLDSVDWVVVLSKRQRRTLLHALDYLFMNETEALDNNNVSSHTGQGRKWKKREYKFELICGVSNDYKVMNS